MDTAFGSSYDGVAADANIQAVFAESSSLTLDKARAELVRGPSGLLVRPILQVKAIDGDGILVLRRSRLGLKKGGY